MVGLRGLQVGPRNAVVDTCGLVDPFLARLPVAEGPWRIGHFERAVPQGYVESVRRGRNELVDPDLRRLYDRIALLTSAPLGAPGRMRAILGLEAE